MPVEEKDDTWVEHDEQSLEKEQEKAARIIQRAWRKYIDVRVFNYYKQLINFRRNGDPQFLLKCVNPREAALLDSAAGVHIRFRLGGAKFPPNIYYKIYTHRPIVDLCASSPKDYTKPEVKQPLPRQIHHHGEIPKDDCSGWYKRVENNGWRLLTNKFWEYADPIAVESSTKSTDFHFSKLQRKQMVEKRRKQKKIEWMKKMYLEGALQTKTDDPNATVLVQRAAEGFLHSVDDHGMDSVMEWEVDELLAWTNALDFEEYLDRWKEVATSNSSAIAGARFIISQYDQYEFTKMMPETSQDNFTRGATNSQQSKESQIEMTRITNSPVFKCIPH
ncbi:protein MFI [Protopterus annectens]|uniref:protein MFI n=1 Tax=Protopterus annectens TaxID=7888 RepID=UPI001CFBF2CD|nr:protein MFI [Protopterus annectens]